MTRSYKKHATHSFACGADTTGGKKITNKMIRAHKRRQLTAILKDPEDADYQPVLQDKNRGSKGSKERNYGWDYWGDGFVHYWNLTKEKAVKLLKKEERWQLKLFRK
jgi:hypothetical protein